jgi:hypothetical protein
MNVCRLRDRLDRGVVGNATQERTGTNSRIYPADRFAAVKRGAQIAGSNLLPVSKTLVL